LQVTTTTQGISRNNIPEAGPIDEGLASGLVFRDYRAQHRTKFGFRKNLARRSAEKGNLRFSGQKQCVTKQLRNPINGSATIDGIPVFWG
jgi:hypothetical protein